MHQNADKMILKTLAFGFAKIVVTRLMRKHKLPGHKFGYEFDGRESWQAKSAAEIWSGIDNRTLHGTLCPLYQGPKPNRDGVPQSDPGQLRSSSSNIEFVRGRSVS